MKKRSLLIGLTVVALAGTFVILNASTPPPVAARPVRLVITGPEGQRFAGRYDADGVTNSLSATAPAMIDLQARDVGFEFTRQGGNGEFRVALYVGDRCRTSTTSDTRQGVRGRLNYTSTGESYWAAGF